MALVFVHIIESSTEAKLVLFVAPDLPNFGSF